MRGTITALLILVSMSAAIAGEIREFSIPTLEKLGNELSHRDEIAARASDAVLDSQPVARSLKLRGWISELSKSGDKVHLITQTPSGPVLAYTVTFRGGKPQVDDRRGEALPASIALRYKALNTASAAVDGKLYKEANYNFEILNDPDGSGFLIYALAATQKKGEILTGGHYRVTVSADGTKAERVDLLTGLVRQSVPTGAKPRAIVSTQLTSTLPVETWIYTSHLYHLPVYLGARNRGPWRFWHVVNGKFYKFSDAEMAEIKKAQKEEK